MPNTRITIRRYRRVYGQPAKELSEVSVPHLKKAEAGKHALRRAYMQPESMENVKVLDW